MAMTIMNNTGAMLTLGQLNKNISKVGKELKKVSSGMKLNSAGDDASAYAISERMRVRIRGLEQDIDNVKKGKSLLEVGAGGIDEIVQELRNLKELAINAANDHNTDQDRATIQKEFDQRMENINDIASTTNYNGKLLLNGDYARFHQALTSSSSGGAGGTGASSSGGTGAVSPSGTPVIITSGPYTISTAGIYVLDNGFTGSIDIANGLSGVKIQQASSAPLTNVVINGPSAGNANLWIDGLNIQNANNNSWIRFSGNNNVLTIEGTNTFTNSFSGVSRATINIGGGLTVEGTGSLNVKLDYAWGAIIGTDRSAGSSADLTINSGTYYMTVCKTSRTSPQSHGSQGAIIGSGAQSSIGDITINGGSFDIFNAGGGAGIGSGLCGSAGDITIKNAAVTIVTDDGACIGSGQTNSGYGGAATVGDILIEDSNIDVENRHIYTIATAGIGNDGDGAGIGSGFDGSNAGDIIIRNSNVDAVSKWGAGIGSGQNSHAGGILMDNVTGNTSSVYGEPIGKGKNGTIGTISTGSGGGSSTAYQGNRVLGTPLVIHTGTKSNQALWCYIPDMHTKNMGLEGVSVINRQNAESSLAKLDKAINYALDAATEVGAYIQELNACEDNLVTNNENTQFSESTIRDADMAKSITEYTKSNVLAQASQSMLAQANQTSASVLSLLQ